MTTPAEISACLGVIEHQNDKHWSWSYAEDKHYWKIKYTGITPVCEIYAEINSPCLCLQIEMGEFRVRPECRAALYLFLLRLNDDLPLVKFGVNDGGRVVLMAEALTSQAGLNVLEELLRSAIAVFRQYRGEIELLAADDNLASLLLKPVETAQDRPLSIKVVKREPSQS